jgi:uncharacterized damage-inducible protein DinB
MTIGEVRVLFGYDAWANRRLILAAEDLSAGELGAGISSFGTLHGTLGHIIGSEWIWMRRWRRDSPAAAPTWATDASLAELKNHLAAVEAERRLFLEGLADADLDRVAEYQSLDGGARTSRLGDTFLHVTIHSTYHRGQAATQLRQVGRTPPNLSFLAFQRLER